MGAVAKENQKTPEELKDQIKQQEESHKAVEAVRKSVKDVERDTSDKVTTTVAQCSQQFEAETRTSIRAGGEVQKEIRYDSTSLFTMGFLEKLSEFKN